MTDDDSEEPPDPAAFTDPSPNTQGDANLAVLGDVLQEHGVTRLVVRYDGCGDSGCADEVEFTPDNVPLPAWLQDRLRDAAEGYCPDGYANDDGGHGSLTVHPFSGLAELEHRDRYEGTEALDASAPSLPEGLRQRLTQLGISCLTARFDGCGDSGMIEEIAVDPESVTLSDELEGELEDFLLDALPGGWEINEGSFGDLTVDVAEGAVEVDAQWRVERESEARVTRWKWRN